ncbi:MAG: molybdopterin-dependent oxidoreductase, partial [Deltaproteobacteria bacterium]|nr:molybdopterin-dependent oxidoreductase [Deltaproteobacteria bacterium]
GSESGFFLGDKFKIPKYPIEAKYRGKARAAFNFKENYPLGSSTPLQDIIKASIPGMYDKTDSEALIKGWLVYSSNLMRAIPEPEIIRKAIESLDLLVVVETMPSEIAGFADVILPDTTYLERHDVLNSPPWREPFVSIRQPVVKPLHNSKPSWWIAQQLANRLYLDDFFPYNHYQDVIEYQLNQLGSSIKDINAKHGVLKKPYKKPRLKFKTPSKKIELYSQRLVDFGHDPMPEYHKQKMVPESFFRLLYGRTPQHTFTKTTNNSMLLELFPENEVWVNNVIAEMFNLKNQDYVILENQAGVRSNKVKVRLTKRIRQDCVFLVHGFGRGDRRLKKGFGRGADDNSLLTDYVTDPIMGSTGSQVNFVTFVK